MPEKMPEPEAQAEAEPAPVVVTEQVVTVTPASEEVSATVAPSVSTNFTVINTKGDQEFISVTENTDEEFEFVHRIRVKSTGKFYGIDEDGSVFTILGESAPLVKNIEDCDLEDGVTWDESEEILVFDEENSGNE